MLSEKYYRYQDLLTSYQHTVIGRIQERFPPEDLAKFDEMLAVISRELMSEDD